MHAIDPSENLQLEWNDPRLVEDRDQRRRRYRLLQSWYREHVLNAPHGWLPARAATAKRPPRPARPVGNLLDADWSASHPTGNFLHTSPVAAEILSYVQARMPQVRASGGSLDPDRLHRNLLSSMPLCFNVFAPLRARPEVAVDVLRRAFALPAVELADVAGASGIECEWAPPSPFGIADRTAFDAVIAYRNEAGQRCLLGVETKYTETFSRETYGRPDVAKEAARRASYERWTAAGWFVPGAADRLWPSATNQLWRMVMLAAACEQLPDVDRVDVAVLALHRDRHAADALQGVRAEMQDSSRLRDLSIERLLRLTAHGELGEWSRALYERYVNLSLIATDDVSARDDLQARIDELFPSGCLVDYDIAEEEPYVVECPHPVVRLVGSHLELLLWRADNWAGDYRLFGFQGGETGVSVASRSQLGRPA